jgi:serine/threonine-protein kinase
VRSGCAAAALIAGLTSAPPAPAQPAGTANDKVAAESLFEEGRTLVAAGKYAEACPKFADSQRLDPSPATLLNLASCHEKAGHSATAWATYKEAASAANASGRSDYVATAQRHAEALAAKLARLTIVVSQPIEGLQVSRDSLRIDHAEWSVAIPIDSGTHSVGATAPGFKAWSSSVQVDHDGAQVSVTIPALEALPRSEQTVALPIATSAADGGMPPPLPLPPPVQADGASVGSGQRIAGLVIAGSGIVGLGVGAAFVLVANAKYHDSLGNCLANNPNLCNEAGVQQRSDARTAGDAASIALSVGAAAFIGGAVIWLTAPSGAPRGGTGGVRAAIAPTLGGAVLQGGW